MNLHECEVLYCGNGCEDIDNEIDILYIDHENKMYMLHKYASVMVIDGCGMGENDIYDYKLISKSLFDIVLGRLRKIGYEEW